MYLLEGDRDLFRSHFAQILKNRECQTCELKLNPRNSEGFFARLDSIFIGDASGKGVVRTSISDISCSRNAAEVLRQAHDELEKRVEERTIELSTMNEQLRDEIEDRKQAEGILRETEAKFRSYVESAPLAIFVADREGRLIDFNRAAVDLLGYDAAIPRNMNVLDIHPESEREKALRKFAILLETGKELVARALHRLSSRKGRPLITVNCASLPPTLIEGELFGRERGAYTGALTKMDGRFEIADGSTLFLDEIGEIPIELQSKLLRVLEEGSFERLGSAKPLRVDVRIIAATNRDLEREVKESRFRKDLLYYGEDKWIPASVGNLITPL